AEPGRFAAELRSAGAREAEALAARCVQQGRACAAAALETAVAENLSAAESADRVSAAYEGLKRTGSTTDERR
ncbi:MAG TPA: hypothetical protein VM221_09200, partial [Armatimonadota bacterium]|nr:hypothetical protein [Armatimonadota bacterium]